MTSERKINANRTNARVSTGPKTPHGRVRSAKNAFRHGLSRSVQSNQALCEELQVLANQIAGPHASAHIKLLALGVAEAQIDLRRIRAARDQILSRPLSNPDYDTRTNEQHELELIGELLRPPAAEIPTAPVAAAPPQGAQRLVTILLQEDEKLLRMDRYERRALSRRKFAIRAFDAARHRKPPKEQASILAERSQKNQSFQDKPPDQ